MFWPLISKKKKKKLTEDKGTLLVTDHPRHLSRTKLAVHAAFYPIIILGLENKVFPLSEYKE